VPRPPWPWLPGTPRAPCRAWRGLRDSAERAAGCDRTRGAPPRCWRWRWQLGRAGKRGWLALVYLRAVHRGVDLRERVPFFDLRVEVDEHVRDPAIDLGAHIDLENRLHGARACTFSITSPTAATAVTYLAGGSGRWLARHTSPAVMATMATPAMTPRRSQRRPPSSAARARLKFFCYRRRRRIVHETGLESLLLGKA